MKRCAVLLVITFGIEDRDGERERRTDIGKTTFIL